MRFLQDWRGKSGGGIYVGIIYTNFVLLYPNSPRNSEDATPGAEIHWDFMLIEFTFYPVFRVAI
jgi:hypothetical protein